MKKTFLSFGGGVQTTAMLIMIAQGKLQADAVIFADTGSEHPETYEYIEKYDKPLCIKMGIPFITAKMHRSVTVVNMVEKRTWKHPKKKLYPVKGEQIKADSLREVLMARRRVPSLQNRWCTEYSKITPIKQVLRSLQSAGEFEKPAICMIGISIDEKRRAYNKDGTWKQPHHSESRNTYPLVEMGISRDDCHKIIKDFGWPDPVKSGCYFCPFQGGKEWNKLYWDHPDLFWDSVMLEERDLQFPTYRLYQQKPLRRLASGPGFGHGNMTLYDDWEGNLTCGEVEASCFM